MELHNKALLLCLMISFFISMLNGVPAQDPEAVELWFKNLSSSTEKITKLHFYGHETFVGKDPTTINIGTPSNSGSLFPYGYTAIGDVPLRSGPEQTSQLVGRSQGLGSVTDHNEVSIVMAVIYEFTDGEFNGSTLTILGRNPIDHKFREMPILGGTGAFRLARGIATLNTYFLNSTSGHLIVEYNLVVIHY